MLLKRIFRDLSNFRLPLQHYLNSQVLYNYLLAFFERLFGLSETYLRPFTTFQFRPERLLYVSTSEYFADTSSIFTLNKNINFAVTDSPHTDNNVRTFIATMRPIESTRKICNSGDSDCMKRMNLHEEPNYHTRFGQAKPDCPPGKWRAGTAFHRI